MSNLWRLSEGAMAERQAQTTGEPMPARDNTIRCQGCGTVFSDINPAMIAKMSCPRCRQPFAHSLAPSAIPQQPVQQQPTPPVQQQPAPVQQLPARPIQQQLAAPPATQRGTHNLFDFDSSSPPRESNAADDGFMAAHAAAHRPNLAQPDSAGALVRKEHSGLGIASFLIAFLVGGLDVILAVVIATGIARTENRRTLENDLLGGVTAMVCFNCASVPLCIVGIGLGVVALIAHPNRNHLFSWMGLMGNGIVVLTLGVLWLFGVMAK